jgi:hypothetical protein
LRRSQPPTTIVGLMRQEVPCGIGDCPFICASAPARLVHIKAMHTSFDGTVIGAALKGARVVTLPDGSLKLIENGTELSVPKPAKETAPKTVLPVAKFRIDLDDEVSPKAAHKPTERDFVLIHKEKESEMTPRITVYANGFFRLNAKACAALGAPKYVHLFYAEKGYFGIRAADKDDPDSYKLTDQSTRKNARGYLISAKPVIHKYKLVPKMYEPEMIGLYLAFKPEHD